MRSTTESPTGVSRDREPEKQGCGSPGEARSAMAEMTGAWKTAVAGLIAATESKLRRRIPDTPVYTIVRDGPGTRSVPVPTANGHHAGQRSTSEPDEELNRELHRLEVELARSAWQHVKSESAERKTASCVRRLLLWASLLVGIAVQMGLLVWLGWEIVHPLNYSHLIPPIVSNALGGGATAYTARGFLKGKSGKSSVVPKANDADSGWPPGP